MQNSYITTRLVLNDGDEYPKGTIIDGDDDFSEKDLAHLRAHGAILPVDGAELAALKAVRPRELTRDEIIAHAKEVFGLTLVDANDPLLPNLARMNKPELIVEADSYGLGLPPETTVVAFREAIAAEREKRAPAEKAS